ncbi:hypothetical protein [Rhizobium sp. Leaf321]|uniref:hypothetical protein n=1 Tax=Rhizobium sp. Leaf321 TaxID=1736335 RepID=UPI0012E37E81|nr:hypothetical protein [Rhizobium sp. Leaf321]
MEIGETVFKDRVRERDLDNFLVEELHASEDFREWLLSNVAHAFLPPSPAEIRVRKSPPRAQDSRQTDVQVGWFDAEDNLIACLLLESKITADFQIGQAEAYALELGSYRAKLGTHCAAALLLAPATRIASLTGVQHFDASVPVEDITKFLAARAAQPDLPTELVRRLEARCDLLDAICGKKLGAAWQPITVPAKRAFSEHYTELANKILPKLKVRQSHDGPKALTKVFEGVHLPSDFPSTRVKHEFGSKVATKYANIQLSGYATYRTSLMESGLLEGTGFTVEATDKALFVRIATPGVDPTAQFETQRENVEEGIRAVGKLVDWLEGKAESLQALLSPVSTATKGNRSKISGEHELGTALLEIYRQCEKLGYRPSGLLDLARDLGAVQAVKRLIANPISEGYGRLAALGRLDLTVEALALQPRWEGIFTEAELTICRRRLR